ncbi:unnamed protein product [Arctogadus glacialis]
MTTASSSVFTEDREANHGTWRSGHIGLMRTPDPVLRTHEDSRPCPEVSQDSQHAPDPVLRSHRTHEDPRPCPEVSQDSQHAPDPVLRSHRTHEDPRPCPEVSQDS